MPTWKKSEWGELILCMLYNLFFLEEATYGSVPWKINFFACLEMFGCTGNYNVLYSLICVVVKLYDTCFYVKL